MKVSRLAGNSMYSLELTLPGREAVRDALLGEYAEGGLFVEGGWSVAAGSPLQVRLSVLGLAAPVFLEGVVQWRRAHTQGTLRRGLGMRLLSAHSERFSFLMRWASSEIEDQGRSEARFPIDRKVLLASFGKGSQRLLHGTLRDVSAMGAQLSLPAPVIVSTVYAIELTVAAGVSYPFRGLVVWSQGFRSGMRVLLESSEARQYWSQLVETAKAEFRAGTLRPSQLPPGR